MPQNPKLAPWPVLCPSIEKKIEDKRMEIHQHRVNHARKAGELHIEEPRGMPSTVNGKKLELEQEKKFELEAENSRLYHKPPPTRTSVSGLTARGSSTSQVGHGASQSQVKA